MLYHGLQNWWKPSLKRTWKKMTMLWPLGNERANQEKLKRLQILILLLVQTVAWGMGSFDCKSIIVKGFLSYPTYICSEAQEDIVSQLEEYMWFTICRHSLGAILVLEIYSISLAIWLDHVKESSNYKKMTLFLAGSWLRSYISPLAVGI